MWQHHPKVDLCSRALRAGQVIAYPTEAVWGLGCDPFNPRAVEQLLRLKQRHWSKGLILVAADISQFDVLLHDLDAAQRQQLESSWPGHITWLVRHAGRVPASVTGRHPAVALRVSQHPLVRALCLRYGGPVVSTSANPQGKQPAIRGFGAQRYFRDSGVVFAPGVVGAKRRPSTIKDLASGAVIR